MPKQAIETVDQSSEFEESSRQRAWTSPIRRFWFEIVALVFLGLGIFLLVEKLQIKSSVYGVIVQVGRAVFGAGQGLASSITSLWNNVEKSDFVGVGLVLVAFMMIAHRSRKRAIARHYDIDLDEGCPQCTEQLSRVPRSLSDRLRESILRIRIRRYSCSKCDFRHTAWHYRNEVRDEQIQT